MEKVYLVTSGCYSDYCVHRVFSTKENAQKWMGDDKDFEIEEFDLDDMSGHDFNVLNHVRVKMDYYGKVLKAEQSIGEPGRLVSIVKPWGGVYPVLSVHVKTLDIDEAVKVTNEIRARIIALGRWPMDGKSAHFTYELEPYG